MRKAPRQLRRVKAWAATQLDDTRARKGAMITRPKRRDDSLSVVAEKMFPAESIHPRDVLKEAVAVVGNRWRYGKR